MLTGISSGAEVLRATEEDAAVELDEEHKVPFGAGIYSEEWTDRTYRELLSEARRALARGNSVILDASWSKAHHRAEAREIAAQREALFGIVECTAPEELLRARLSNPKRRVTDGRIELLDDQRASYEPLSAEEADLLIQIDTSGDFELAATRALEALFA